MSNMPDNISQQRNAIRQQVRAARNALLPEQQQQASSQLLTYLVKHPKVQQAQHISVTLAHDGEIDLHNFIEWCWQQKKQVYLPVVHPTNVGELLFLAYQENTIMIKNRYGIKEPRLDIIVDHIDADNEDHDNESTSTSTSKSLTSYLHTCSPENLDIVFTPLVAFDQQGNRIGMGGGYYDRLLAPWFSDKIGPYPIGVAHNCQCVDLLPIQEWDVPLPEIMTPLQHFHFSE
ncbi:5-formyltetrahydrofolate cyclo-ligase [uncultured Psychromonas sp.]|uniref:5-formyltetrahydrofolate cyclo-ligase n=1 Tax=uncultured Psychromonas sp. TaxID=173974 RepID=UPI0026144DDF|nr:5-formyltetrahydrofolate cyclo-ligase [uncultured Psychromonas sp.]